MYTLANERTKVLEIFDKFKEAKLPPSIYIYNMHLDAAIRLNDSNRIVETLHTIAQLGMTPKRHYLKILGQMKDLPDRVFMALQSFWKFANVRYPKHRFSSHSFRPRKRMLGRLLKRTGKHFRPHKGIKQPHRYRGYPFM
eukprot:TRINITY_DN456_c0_g1_i10.p2 TRINITY_DN456_c0_g1~~TRINITY_DN456_c0_g1_i10.p2  ORF type:complete len:140 (+),score=24.78 TRINITY_DN456_c0_g1_i10:261-680(+)